jgi:hypothetical protein
MAARSDAEHNGIGASNRLPPALEYSDFAGLARDHQHAQ